MANVLSHWANSVSFLVLICSSCVIHVEHDARPQAFHTRRTWCVPTGLSHMWSVMHTCRAWCTPTGLSTTLSFTLISSKFPGVHYAWLEWSSPDTILPQMAVSSWCSCLEGGHTSVGEFSLVVLELFRRWLLASLYSHGSGQTLRDSTQTSVHCPPSQRLCVYQHPGLCPLKKMLNNNSWKELIINILELEMKV